MKQECIFVEGIQGTGKTTFVNNLSEQLGDFVNQMLYFMMPEDEIIDFYKSLKDVLADRIFRITA